MQSVLCVCVCRSSPLVVDVCVCVCAGKREQRDSLDKDGDKCGILSKSVP